MASNQKERWGKPYRDRRTWPTYNEELVVRGEFLLDLAWVCSWDEELMRMNEHKRGHPYEFPESLIELQAVWNQWIGLRQVEGITRALVEAAQLPQFNDYSTINRRIRNIQPSFALPKHGFCSVSTDGTGIKMHNAGEYRKGKYGNKKRRWIKVVLSANPLTKDMLDLEISLDGGGLSEPEAAQQHLQNLYNHGITVDKFWGDGTFDVLQLFNLLERHSTESAIPPRSNASNESKGSMRRAREVREFKSKEWNTWAQEKQYGKRWLGTEVIFSAVKGVFGENTRAKTPETAFAEVHRRFWAYERMRKYAQRKISGC